MNRDYASRLQQLRARRHGYDDLSGPLGTRFLAEAVQKAAELYEQKGKTDAQKYALRAMQEVNSGISYNEGERP